MAGTDDKSVLDAAIEQHREAAGPEQPALLPEVVETGLAPGARTRGRPAGSRNLRSEAYAALLIRQAGADPLLIAAKIAAYDVLDEEKVLELARVWGCSKFDAVKLWVTINRDVQPYLHQKLPTAVILNPGAPGGERVMVEIDGEYRDVTPDDEPEEDAA